MNIPISEKEVVRIAKENGGTIRYYGVGGKKGMSFDTLDNLVKFSEAVSSLTPREKLVGCDLGRLESLIDFKKEEQIL
jgi:hypothetical protein